MKLRRIKAVQEPAHVINRRKRRRQRILRAVRSILVTALFAVTMIYAALSPFFNIKDIIADGSKRYSISDLTAHQVSGRAVTASGFYFPASPNRVCSAWVTRNRQ